MAHSFVWRDIFISVTWLKHLCDMTYSSVWHDSSISVTWLIHVCDMTHSLLGHDASISSPITESCHTYEWFLRTNESCRTYEWVLLHVRMSLVARTNESCYTYEWVVPRVIGCHDALICVKWLVRKCAMTHSLAIFRRRWHSLGLSVWHDSWYPPMCDMTHSEVCHDSFIGGLRRRWHSLGLCRNSVSPTTCQRSSW